METQEFLDFLLGVLADDNSGMIRLADAQKNNLDVEMLDGARFTLTVTKQNLRDK